MSFRQFSASSTPYDTQINTESALTHVNKDGKAKMVDVGHKHDSERVAVAKASIKLGKKAYELVVENKMRKGDVLTVSQLGGIMAAKQTSTLIPLCHNIPLNKVEINFKMDDNNSTIHVLALAKTIGKTGVEMEALTAASVTALTIYDMCKAVTHDIVITDVMLVEKTGGVHGDLKRKLSV